jgi:predicted regulator of Ras-like GTPase activity (Roadblock/LC7/MglB family)
MVDELQSIVEDVRRFVPTLLGAVIISEDGLPVSYSFSKAWDVEDPIVISGLISSAVAMMENVLKEFGDSETELVFTQGKDYSLLVSRAGNVFVGFIATADTKLGPLFMEMRKQSRRIEQLFAE